MLIGIDGDGVYEVSDIDGERIHALVDSPGATADSDFEGLVRRVHGVGVLYAGTSAPDFVLVPDEYVITYDSSDAEDLDEPADHGWETSGHDGGTADDSGGPLNVVEDTDRRFG